MLPVGPLKDLPGFRIILTVEGADAFIYELSFVRLPFADKAASGIIFRRTGGGAFGRFASPGLFLLYFLSRLSGAFGISVSLFNHKNLF
jgi:hypothetical protein